MLEAFGEAKKNGAKFDENLKKYEDNLAKWNDLPDAEKKKSPMPEAPEAPAFPKEIYEEFSRMNTADLAHLKNAEPEIFTHQYFAPNLKWNQISKMPGDPSFPSDYHREIRRKKDYWIRFGLDMQYGIDAFVDFDKLTKDEQDQKIAAIEKVRGVRQRLVRAGVNLKTGLMQDETAIPADLKDTEGKQISADDIKMANLNDEEKKRIAVGEVLTKKAVAGRSHEEIPMGRSEMRNDPLLIRSLGMDTLTKWEKRDKIDIKRPVQIYVSDWERQVVANNAGKKDKDGNDLQIISDQNLEMLNYQMNDPQGRGQQFYQDADLYRNVNPEDVRAEWDKRRGKKGKGGSAPTGPGKVQPKVKSPPKPPTTPPPATP